MNSCSPSSSSRSTCYPIQPQLGLNNSFIFARAGPADPGFGEWNSLFTRNGVHVLGHGLVGGNSTYGDQVVVTGIWDRLSVSIGQLHYETDGFRPNNDLEENIYQIFAQFQLSSSTSIQVEYRHRENEQGDLPLRFDPDDFEPTLRQTFDSDSARIGVRQVLTPSSLLIGSLIYEDDRTTLDIFGFHSRVDQTGYHPELQYLYRSPRLSLVAGAGYFTADGTDSDFGDFETRHGNVYLYPQVHLPWNVHLTLGASVDVLSSSLKDTTQFNPKLGAIWNPVPGTTFRAAAFRALEKPLFSGPFDRADSGLGLQPALRRCRSRRGLMALRRRVGSTAPRARVRGRRGLPPGHDCPVRDLRSDTEIAGKATADWKEYLVRAYGYWAVTDQIALSAEYLYERLERDPEILRRNPSRRERHAPSAPVDRLLPPFGTPGRGSPAPTSTRAGVSEMRSAGVNSGSDQFWVLDASIGYRLPKRFGLITLEGRNLLDHRFHYNDNDFGNPRSTRSA